MNNVGQTFVGPDARSHQITAPGRRGRVFATRQPARGCLNKTGEIKHEYAPLQTIVHHHTFVQHKLTLMRDKATQRPIRRLF